MDSVGKDSVKLFTKGAGLCVKDFVGESHLYNNLLPSFHLKGVVSGHLGAFLLWVNGILLIVNKIPERERESFIMDILYLKMFWQDSNFDHYTAMLLGIKLHYSSCLVNHTQAVLGETLHEFSTINKKCANCKKMDMQHDTNIFTSLLLISLSACIHKMTDASKWCSCTHCAHTTQYYINSLAVQMYIV